MKINISIIGAGSWGTTLAIMLAQKGYGIKLWARSKSTLKEIKENRTNFKYTGNILIPENVTGVFESSELFINSELIILALPSHAIRAIILNFRKDLLKNSRSIKAIINVAKGLETGTNLRLTEVIRECIPQRLSNKIAVLSGPNIATEIVNKLPSVSVISSTNKELLKYLQNVFFTDYFRVYTNEDIVGVEIAGAVKNIIAIAAGISDGLGYGANAKASLITRGLYELSKIGKFFGANLQTFSGAAGMGDLIATCISKDSRNRNVGERLARGESINNIIESMYMIAEGINTTKAIHEIAKINKLEAPITEIVYKIIYKGLNPASSVNQLMTRKFRSEV
ncbi:MAG: NAD(P)-dependent glycerol-3-phosphate dehydrogenase [Actinobacteria bacterium]|nr:NAD(P)-dependent glycerol-3-phosphate dehydrogenase [Actinomycetota bacterium]